MDLTLIWKALLIGVVEGLTEFLPVSSTGHIILAEEVLHFQGPPGKVFEIVIQLGAILAVCLLYRAKIWTTVEGVLQRDKRAIRFATAIAVAFLPAAIVGVAAHKYIKSVLFSPWVVAIALIVGGIAILLIERFAQRPRIKTLDDVDLKTALYIGLCQCLAMIPGVSRAGATIMGARAFRVDRATAAEFSFFLAMPTMLGATVYDLYKNWSALSWEHAGIIALGFVAAFLSAMLVVRAFVRFISRHGFTVFAWYRIAVGALALTLLLMR
ncbi:undecaprenyl-diphosphate phosphatase [Reyranella sp. MMS21-HV4-11]|jgi:undecaprenyl-diphosphatase|uniref:Undecaprenyl-diphosphatase n=1 Tax=Reyranella humidisoli TaxID=2849149 RepID=A0ABS6IP13_9HYPH|nr:undecaprenyl-diphosphate phosphatase [Reyranella sp. MMS21-HV4-11]MBU8876344.1 undecaprenyl-diphosphate phosphatase [Reyranella sp. MMS21-HV4-11]